MDLLLYGDPVCLLADGRGDALRVSQKCVGYRRTSKKVISQILLRDVEPGDLDTFFEFERDKEAAVMAAFTADDPNDRAAFDAHWERLRRDSSIKTRTIVADGEVAGYVAHFMQFSKPSIAYWVGKPLWNRGIATRAVRAFLAELPQRPLFARVAFDNAGSRKVLEHCGFERIATEEGFAAARGTIITEFLYELRVSLNGEADVAH